jgi:hypothetical protein
MKDTNEKAAQLSHVDMYADSRYIGLGLWL